jgi:hypothetical protein
MLRVQTNKTIHKDLKKYITLSHLKAAEQAYILYIWNLYEKEMICIKEIKPIAYLYLIGL